MKDLSLYIHIPFCRCICLYCNFLTFANKTGQKGEYVKALSRQIRLLAPECKNRPVKSIYFGGGTPSLLDDQHIQTILENIQTNYNVTKNAEISIEANPETISIEKIEHYKDMGINRLTIGIQSLNDKSLFRVGRIHNKETILNAISILKQKEFKNFGIDYIIGMPFQTFETFKNDLNTFIKLKIPHISLYFLSYDTPKIDHFIKDCPNEDEQIKIYEYACQTLKIDGFTHYEVSNFAKTGFESVHNKRYWQQKEYLGFGIGAHSFFNNTVSENTNNFEEFLKAPLSKEDSFQLDPDLKRMDFIMLALRQKSGINLTTYQKIYGKESLEKLIANAKKLMSSGHMSHSGDCLFATEKGFLILNHITEALL